MGGKKLLKRFWVIGLVMMVFSVWAGAGELFEKPKGVSTGWSSFENLNGLKGQGGKENDGAKGHAFDKLQPGESKTLLDIEGSGIITRMWVTVNDKSQESLRSLRLDMYWDGAETPAVSVPFGDFFGAILGKPVAFESELFSNPEGKSFNCFIPMPFRKRAKVVITNESDNLLRLLFFDINYLLGVKHKRDVLYFHATWNRQNPTKLMEDFEILPLVEGSGKFLGTHIGVVTNKQNLGWWGEGEVKVFIDEDTDFATLVGTGTEDYIGTGWGQGTFDHQYQGCLISDKELGEYTFYRYHVPDPVYFDKKCRVTIQQMGGTGKQDVIKMVEDGVPVVPVSAAWAANFSKLLEEGLKPEDLGKHESPEGAWVNFWRQDDVCATAFFYLNKPENHLPVLLDVTRRIEDLVNSKDNK